jgi:prophage regulatory protein
MKTKSCECGKAQPPGLLRLKSIIGPSGLIPMSRSAFYAAVKAGRFPAPVKLGPRIVAWKSTEIQKLIDDGLPPAALTKRGDL